MKGSQRHRRVLLSRWGVLSILSFILLSFLLSYNESPRISDVTTADPLPLVLFALVIVIPLVIWSVGLTWVNEQDIRKFLEENPDVEKELNDGKSLVDLLYEYEKEK